VTSMVEMYENGASVAEIAKTFRAPLSVVEKRVAGTVRKAIVFAPPKPAMIVWEAPEPRIRRPARKRNPPVKLSGNCPVCFGPVLKSEMSHAITCSKACARDWKMLRNYLSLEARLRISLSKAKSVLKNADRRKPGDVKHAQNVLAGLAEERRRFSEPKRRGTKVYFAWQRAQRKRALNGASR
jgi:hypothetical protein